jgi:O-antigen/teichoic acid export membrane protein
MTETAPTPASPLPPPTHLARALPPVYAAAALRLAFPLAVLPVMAARLGADEFGRLGLMLVWAGLLAMLVEGGFLAAATRLAVNADADGRWRLAQQVFSARCALSAVAAAAAAAVVPWVAPGLSAGATVQQVVLLAALACALGWPATWYLQASGQLHRWARVEMVVHAVWLAAALALAHSVGVYLLLNLLAALALAGAGWWWLRRDLRPSGAPFPSSPSLPSPRSSLLASPAALQGTQAVRLGASPVSAAAPAGLWSRPALDPGLRLGWTMLPVSVAGAAYSFALPAVASAQMPRADLGLYYLVDRVVRAVLAAAEPLYQVVYPRIVLRFGRGAGQAWRYAGLWAGAGGVAGAGLLAAAALTFPLLAPWLVPTGANVERVRVLLLTLGLLWPLLLGWKFLGYAMLGSGRFDRAYRACVVVGGVFGVAAAAAVAAQGALALAGVALAAEAVVIAAALVGIFLTRRADRLAPR